MAQLDYVTLVHDTCYKDYTHNEEIRVGGDSGTYSMKRNYWAGVAK